MKRAKSGRKTKSKRKPKAVYSFGDGRAEGLPHTRRDFCVVVVADPDIE